MTHDCYSTKRTTVWSSEKDGKPGFAIKYCDGYISWCPKDTFERDYRAVEGGHLSFGHAIEALKAGKRVRRLGWNGKGMWLTLARNWQINTLNLADHPPTFPFIAMSTVDGGLVPWLASQTDVLSDDWEEIVGL